MIPIWQFMLGVCVGMVALVLTRPQALNYRDESRGDTRGRSRESFITKPGDVCVICVKVMQIDNMTKLRCGHALHDACYNKCRCHSNNCPVCGEHM
ncbi:PREDICTED: E3 ubiquitin-protein ligase TTC3-like isoform X2 [Rhagoletis zephyria]|uniref:E3 ubiquitin-protein ligase TTC3-like n=1 Tax=Rhagoletis pomonella TaxID=28610 RepID=UPI0008115D8B|nr:PREDICTED: E3 ubiquitin-protein ligase TTC3-like isoform X1 [Rhagoletis zephyria]XP_017473391.1 PREDICTED: E3 ubiquitin-protein ligase TTC3-like isoform X2 [Rhagoletis zephyria]XP_036330656.1 E3 ubiquitin-protein ligase TTC3-like isoform X2 [Rhagoletis pomonella]XP_036330730.1 E3 ubiquitin-protein ligase TTC3-like [Rhagoletis pomonella]